MPDLSSRYTDFLALGALIAAFLCIFSKNTEDSFLFSPDGDARLLHVSFASHPKPFASVLQNPSRIAPPRIAFSLIPALFALACRFCANAFS